MRDFAYQGAKFIYGLFSLINYGIQCCKNECANHTPVRREECADHCTKNYHIRVIVVHILISCHKSHRSETLTIERMPV